MISERDFGTIVFLIKEFEEKLHHGYVVQAFECEGTLHFPQQKKNFCGDDTSLITIETCCKDIPKEWLHKKVKIQISLKED